MSVITLNLTEAIELVGNEIFMKGSTRNSQLINIRKYKSILINIFNLDKKNKHKNHFIKNIYETAGKKSSFVINNGFKVEVKEEFISDNETEYFNFNESINKKNKIYFQDIIEIDNVVYI